MPIGHSKAMWQCKWHNFVAKFGSTQCKWRHLITKFWNNLQEIRKCIFCNKSENAYSREIQNWNIANLMLWNAIGSQSRFSGLEWSSSSQDYFKLLSVRKLIQVEMLYPGSVVPLAMFVISTAGALVVVVV